MDPGEGCAQIVGCVERGIGIGVSAPEDAVGGLRQKACLGVGLSVNRVWKSDVLEDAYVSHEER
jgi:hypothetical protein